MDKRRQAQAIADEMFPSIARALPSGFHAALVVFTREPEDMYCGAAGAGDKKDAVIALKLFIELLEQGAPKNTEYVADLRKTEDDN